MLARAPDRRKNPCGSGCRWGWRRRRRRACREAVAGVLAQDALRVPFVAKEGVKLLGDTAAVTALLDRLLHHAHVLRCGPRSRRTKIHTDLRLEEATS